MGDSYYGGWWGSVYIPVGLSPEEIAKTERIWKLYSENCDQIEKREKMTEKFFEILERHQEINRLLIKSEIEWKDY